MRSRYRNSQGGHKLLTMNKEERSLKLGRKPAVDERDENYLLQAVVPKKVVETQKYWDADGWWGDQGWLPQCVGYAWAHFIEDGPVGHEGVAPIIPPAEIYTEAQKVDEWLGEDYDGTSVRAGAKYLHNQGKISSYLWAWDLDTLTKAVLTKGPVVVGTNWYTRMFYPDANGLIRVGGSLAGGHAYVINGVDTKKKQFRIKNSWGRGWGKSGHAYIGFTDMKRLINNYGEVCLAVENEF